jgi:TusA-related sulfurtransferase
MEYIDLRGMSCPVPVIETKKLLESKDVKEIEVLLDNPASSENVKRFLESKGFATVTTQEGDIYRIKAYWMKRGAPLPE